MINYLNLFYIECALIVVGLGSVISDDSPEDVLNYIDNVQKKLNVTQNSNIILVIGNTGCGKSTLVHYVAGDYSRMFALEPLNPNSVNFEIRDELDPDIGRITLATESRTLIPVISTDENHNAWMDCPGFGDTRNETVEIATAFLIKRVIESASNMKIVLVMNYNSVTNSRDDFDNLLSRATQLMKNVSRFENSISLVVTKAPSFKMRGRHYIDIYEDNIKNLTAHFMIDHRSLLETKGASRSKIQLIESVLGRSTPTSNSNYYPKMSVFWRPDEAGPFNKIERMVTGRRYIRESILNRSSYAPVRMTDFGFPLTPQAQIKVRNMIQHTVDSIETILQHSVDRLIVEIKRQIDLAKSDKSRLEVINVGLSFCQVKKNGSEEMTLDQLTDHLSWLSREYHVSEADIKEFHRLSRHGKNLLILSSLIATDINSSQNSISSDYYSYLEQVNQFLIEKDDEMRKGIESKAREMKRMITKILMDSDQQVLQALHQKIESINSFQNKLKILQTGKNSIQSSEKEITLQGRINQLKRLTYAIEIPSINVTALNYVNRYKKRLSELKSLVGAEFELPIRDWLATSSNAIDYQVSTYDWYLFLEETYRYFSEHDISSRASINETNFGTITKRIRRNADFESTPAKIIEINKIINITMKSPASYKCDGEILTITGRFIRSSDIRDALVTKCSTLEDLKMVKVFVLDTFYVDSDLYLNKTKEIELQVMAPRWNIQKYAKFHLNGNNGESYDQPAKEASGGMHGEPGLNGGNFFGWANVIINSERLFVDVSGGRGANGQDGTGSPDSTVEFDETGFSDSGTAGGRGTPSEYYHRYFRRHGYHPRLLNSTGDVTSFHFFTIGLNVTHRFALHPPRCCGPTGAGGKGGFGGAGGSAHFIHSSSDNEKHLPIIISNNGENGDTGVDGRQCATLKLVLSVITEIDDNIFRFNLKNKFFDKQLHHHDECPIQSGMVFYPGNPRPTRERLHGSINFVPSLIEYNLYLLKNMNDPEDNVAQSTYEAINSDPAISSAYTIKDLVMEANSLEQNYAELSKTIEVLSLYDNLLNRIERFAVLKDGKLSRGDQKVLSMIYTTIFSKTNGMRSSHSTDLIINVGRFLDLTGQNVKKLNELKRIEVINEQLGDYNNVISAKIREAKNFIENDINPEIRRTIPILNDELKKAVDETIALRTKTRNEIDSKEEQLRVMRSNVKARHILSIFELIGELTGVICDSLSNKITGVILKFSAQMLKTYLDDPKITEIHDMPESVEHLRNRMHKNEREKIMVTENELNKLKKSLDNVTNHFTDNLNQFITEANAINLSGSAVLTEVNNFIKNCIEFLRGWHDVATKERNVTIQRPVQRAQYALTVIATSFPTYEQIWSDDDEIGEVVQALNEDSETLEVLKKLEEGIYSELMPLVDEMYEYAVNVEKNLVNKSSVSLDITHWNVKQTIRNVQKKLIDELSQFDIESNINGCMTRLNEAMELLIDIYHRIQNYEEESKFVTYLSELHITSASDSDIHDVEVRKMFNQMKMNLQVNLFLGQYFRVLGAFKQALFPYAADYLADYELPSSLLVGNLNDSITLASQHIESLSEKLKEYNDTVINEHDEHIHSAFFDRNYGSRGPFYVWPNSEIHDRVQQLFTGQKIYLFADVQNSDTRNAVKFHTIALGFHSNNLTMNNRLQEILQSFHVSLTHMGNSNYRCKDTFYTIPSRPWTIKYSIGERNQRPADRNLVHGKLASGPSLLSPYTLWSVQLLYGPFSQLQQFVDFIDIELYGNGLYVMEEAPICETNLEKYYSVMDKIL
ncbi:uncharacterized protein LOC119076658 [Bradysia coprophila]|uniref:uncharacterized protein LOC119076658 n=1 Tax=Bradysia coprophila TaxID=38358 RepID=UPI00187D864E|nr:uncharacterized protein LOC119076658 [Bradysia coprophila]XP_037039436.1 uncharacterized protein LOC119076658 [Bradysia coprophila]